MSTQALQGQSNPHLPPPSGDSTKAEKYISQLIKLVNQNKLLVNHTDLAQFDPSSIEDHYRMELKEYHVEISHSKQPDTSKDFYIMLFTNLQDIRDGCSEKIILAYLYLTEEQFKRFKNEADAQLEVKRKAEEEKRFHLAMAPVEEVLNKMESSDSLMEDIQEVARASTATDDASEVALEENPLADIPNIPAEPMASEELSDEKPLSFSENTLSTQPTSDLQPQPLSPEPLSTSHPADFSSIINEGQAPIKSGQAELPPSEPTTPVPDVDSVTPQTIGIPEAPVNTDLNILQPSLENNPPTKGVADLLNEFSQHYNSEEQPQPKNPPTI